MSLKEYQRRQRLLSHVNDLLSSIEQDTPVLSEEELRMQQQLERYQTKICCLKENIQRLQQFLSLDQEQLQNRSMENMKHLIRNHRNQIDQMKQQLENVQTHQ